MPRAHTTESQMSGVLEETTSREIDCDHVSRRVDDWADRIVALYSAIEGWLPADWSATRDKIRMYEEMMQKFNVSARELPLLKLSYRGKPAGRIEPRADRKSTRLNSSHPSISYAV